MSRTARAWSVAAACCLAAVTCVPVAASADTARPAPTPGPTAPAPRPAPKPTPTPTPPPPPSTHWRTHLPVGAGDRGPFVVGVQQRLLWLGAPIRATHVMDNATLKAVSAFRVKFGMSAGTTVTTAVWKQLTSVSRARGSLPAACRGNRLVLCIDKTQKSLRLVRNGKVLVTLDARFGSAAHPTREGVFHVFAKARYHVSSLYHTPMPYSMFFSGGEAVHYSPFFHRDGYNGHSHGCVGIRQISDAAALYARVPMGTRVVVYRS